MLDRIKTTNHCIFAYILILHHIRDLFVKTYLWKYRVTETPSYRQTELRQTKLHKDQAMEKHSYRKTELQKDRITERRNYWKTELLKDQVTERHSYRKTMLFREQSPGRHPMVFLGQYSLVNVKHLELISIC